MGRNQQHGTRTTARHVFEAETHLQELFLLWRRPFTLVQAREVDPHELNHLIALCEEEILDRL